MEWEVKGKGVQKGEGRGRREGREEGKRRGRGAYRNDAPNQNRKYATGATAIYLSSPVLIPNHNIRH